MKAIIIYYPDDLAENNDETESGIYNNISRQALTEEYGIKERHILAYIPLEVKGKTYAERKADLQNKAIEWSYAQGLGNWSYSELGNISAFFEEQGKRYGLLREFRENGII